MADMGASSALEGAAAPAEALADPDKISYMIHPQVDRAYPRPRSIATLHLLTDRHRRSLQ
jgi:hypothetical protein